MNDASKIKVAAIIGGVIIVLMFIFMVIFVQNNNDSTNKKTSPKKTNTSISKNDKENISDSKNNNSKNIKEIDLEKVYSFGIKDNELVGISEDLSVQNILNLEENLMDYDYEDSKLYLLYIKSKIEIYEIDLKKAEKTKIAEIDEKYNNSFEVYNQNLYWSTGTGIYKYDIQNSKGEEIIKLNDNETLVDLKIDKDNGYIFFLKNVDKEDKCECFVCKTDLENYNQEVVLSSEATGSEILFKNNYLICSIIDNNSDIVHDNNSVVYACDVNRQLVWEFGNLSLSFRLKEAVAINSQYIVFSNGHQVKVIDYDGNIINENLYVEEESKILDITMLTENILQIRVGTSKEDVSKCYLIDFSKETINETEDNFYNVIIKSEE